jgi:glycylpeptide N-tetradecanoyltransferase
MVPDGWGVFMRQGLMQEALVLAKLQDIDVFNALDIMENNTFLQELKFGQGDGHLQVR